MKGTLFGSGVALMWCVVVPLAQQQLGPAATAEPAHKVFVMKGCLEMSPGPKSTFTLTDASPVSPASGPTGEPGAVGTSGQKASYALQPESGVHAQGKDADALKAHAGERVELTMRPVEKAPAAPPPPGSPASLLEPAPERFTVTEIRRTAGTCP